MGEGHGRETGQVGAVREDKLWKTYCHVDCRDIFPAPGKISGIPSPVKGKSSPAHIPLGRSNNAQGQDVAALPLHLSAFAGDYSLISLAAYLPVLFRNSTK